ncbi:MAG: Rne/Rng family ribonuclease, partial [Sphingorhabdus sp.]
HREETRVAVVTGNRIEEFDFESAEHKQLKGNIYLAKVTRVEPSLQAAFIDYGGNRHGFLAFSEIHPDYYQIPREDRERLLAEEAEAAAEEAALREQEEEEDDEPSNLMRSEAVDDEDSDIIEVESDERIDTFDISEGQEPDLDANGDDDHHDDDDGASEERGEGDRGGRGGNRRRRGKGGGRSNAPKASDEARTKRMNLRRRYKIQDVIHRRQVLLVQVVKEERGNKGAALTTYLSLAGRYCVLMPNTSHGGGISRKINSAGDRKRLKTIVSDMNLPATMGCIIRTAGLARTKPEIKRDFDYLARLWDEVRERTLSGAAPMLIHTDSDLIKRAIRDIYNKDIEDVIVEGPDGYKAAKDFMKLLMPSHSKRVQHYADPVSLFQRYGVEDQLNAMYQPIVQLKSGGYIVINPTEALVSIDINSGRSTKEHGIEQTALSTNLEAAREIARQLRLRDMAGLVVIDFIDMDHHSNARKVERAMKEALKHDRARIQVGRISSFGL